MRTDHNRSIASVAQEAWSDAFSDDRYQYARLDPASGGLILDGTPAHLERLIVLGERDDQARQHQIERVTTDDFYMLESIISDELDLEKKAALCDFEHRVSEKLEEVADIHHMKLYELASEMKFCRRSGHIGVLPDGGYQIAWRCKCGCGLFCPHESREETKRVDRKYHSQIKLFEQLSPFNQIHYAVLTIPNVPTGQLRQGMEFILQRFKAVFMTNEHPAIDNIEGALSIIECPMSASGDWNIHLNVIFLMKCRPDYKLMRRCWGYDMEIDFVPPKLISKTFREMVKYVLTGDAEKATNKSESGQSKAPSFFDWPHEAILEYWDAYQGFRKLRSYGELYAIYSKRWNMAKLSPSKRRNERARILADALTYKDDIPQELVQLDWCDIKTLFNDIPDGPFQHLFIDDAKKDTEKLKAVLRRAMEEGANVVQDIKWIAPLNFNHGDVSYRVGSVLGDNFSGNQQRRDNFSNTPPIHDPPFH
jgi:hypothetical protein